MTEFSSEHIGVRSTWVRLLFMILFLFISRVTEVVIFAATVLQFLFKLLTGKPNAQLRSFGEQLGIYVREIVHFLTFHSEHMPFPFNPWPRQDATPPVKSADAGGSPQAA